MRCLLLIFIALIPTMLQAQAPSWQWARSFPSNSYQGAVSSLAQDSGYFMSLDQPAIMLPWGLVEGSTGILLHMNAMGAPTAAVAMPPIMRMLPAGESDARFLVAYRDSCVLTDATLISTAGIGVAMGVVDGEGSISEVMNLPDLVVGTDCAIGDLDLAPNGDLLVVGTFRDSVICVDTTLYGEGFFLCRYASESQLAAALTIPIPLDTYSRIRVVSDGAEGAYVGMQEFGNEVEADTTFGQGTTVASFGEAWELRWAHSNMEETFYHDGPVHVAKAPGGGVYVAYSSAGGAFASGRVVVTAYTDGGVETWTNSSFGPQFDWGTTGVMGIASSPAFNGPVVSIYAYGQLEGYGPYPITNNGTPNAIVATLDSIGQWKWAISDNGPNNVFGAQAVVSPNGTIYANGHFEGNGGLGNHPLTYTPPVSFFAGRIGLGIGPVGVEGAVTGRSEQVLYPNPTRDHVWLENGIAFGNSVILRDTQGRMLSTMVVDRIPFLVELAGLPSGVYLVCTEANCQPVLLD